MTQCPDRCGLRPQLDPTAYAYLFGQYLGDGHVVHTRRGVYRLFLSCCAQYLAIIEQCVEILRVLMPKNTIGRRTRAGTVELSCYSKHWPCLLPQHGAGPKHMRSIVLEPWQAAAVLDTAPDAFVRGLVHSDGYRGTNRVRAPSGRTYAYPRYQFSNRSADIRQLFVEACLRLGVASAPMNAHTISVARRESVATLDLIVGPKR